MFDSLLYIMADMKKVAAALVAIGLAIFYYQPVDTAPLIWVDDDWAGSSN